MSFNWSDFLALAVSLQQNPTVPGPQEASLRTAISRAYYAAFRSARDFAETQEGFAPTHSGQDHWLVRQHYQNRADTIHRKIGTNLGRLYDNRRKADYDHTVSGLPPMAQSSVQVAANILSDLSSI